MINGHTSEESIVCTDPYLGSPGSGIIIIVCVVMRENQEMGLEDHLHIRT